MPSPRPQWKMPSLSSAIKSQATEDLIADEKIRTPRAIIFIAYFETPPGHKTASRLNMQFFLDHNLKAGLIGEEFDVVVMEAQNDGWEVWPTGGQLYGRYWAKLNKHFRWFVVRNEGFDFCLWKKAMNKVTLADYDFFVFMNGSVRGPFVDCSESKTWLREFTNLLDPTSVPPVRLAGTTLNCMNQS